MTDTPPRVEPKVPVSVVCETVGGGTIERGEWDRIVSDLSGNDAGGGGGGSASRISNTCNSTDPGGGRMATPTKMNKLAWVSPVVNLRHPEWSPSLQSYPPLGLHEAMHPSELIGKAGRRPRLTAKPPMEQIDPAIKDIRIVSGRDLTSFRGSAGRRKYVACWTE